MNYKNPTIKNLNLSGKSASGGGEEEQTESGIMSDPRYLRQSSSLINDALQKGFDVLQLANGDIVTTGTKIVVYTYSWDQDRGKLVKSRTSASRRARAARKAERALEESE